MKQKYPIKGIYNSLSKEFIEEILCDLRKLNEIAIDANQDALKYSFLLYDSIKFFNEKITKDIPENYYEHYYNEELSSFINHHLSEIYIYSQSIGYVSHSNKVIERPILVRKLKKYVSDNKRYELEHIDKTSEFSKCLFI